VTQLGTLVLDAGLTATLRDDAAAVDVAAIAYDSRAVERGALFCCLVGANRDGHDYAGRAVSNGAAALLVQRPLSVDVPQVLSDDTRRDMALLSDAFHGHPSRSMRVIGVTGTAGKTTTTHLIGAICEAAGWPAVVLGTLTGQHTTPEAPEFQARLAAARDAGKAAVATEVSSHALDLHRVDGTRFAVSVFTNLGRDHLDFHGSTERYFAAKARLFTPGLSDRAVVNLDDVHGQLLADAAAIPTIGFSQAALTDVTITPTSHTYNWQGVRVHVGLGGSFNVSNSLAAATAALALDIDPATIAAGLDAARPVPGRFEPVDAGQPFSVLVDYAHTPESLAEVLGAARRASSGKLIVVFGAGGDRDREKRPQMGEVAARLADAIVLTSDNPRSEDPAAIIDDIAGGIPDRARTSIEPDRAAAIARGLAAASPGDVVVIAGKGHETTQTIGDLVTPFDDRAVARAALEAQQ
jgi:UDP-N-acetylmuramoyl-L-alanyl-D-glutamate--2,6-diaminopimelate ligase